MSGKALLLTNIQKAFEPGKPGNMSETRRLLIFYRRIAFVITGNELEFALGRVFSEGAVRKSLLRIDKRP
jgi:hypothetical protein